MLRMREEGGFVGSGVSLWLRVLQQSSFVVKSRVFVRS